MLDLARPRPRGHKINPSPGAFPLCRNGRRPKPFTSTESVATSLKVRFSLTQSMWARVTEVRNGARRPVPEPQPERPLSVQSGDLRQADRQGARCADGGHLKSDGLRQTTADVCSQLHC